MPPRQSTALQFPPSKCTPFGTTVDILLSKKPGRRASSSGPAHPLASPPASMKGVTVLMSLLAVLAAAISGFLFFKIDYDKDQLLANNRAAQQQLSAAQQRASDNATDRDRAAADLATAQREIAELKARNTTLEARNSQLARELARHRDDLTAREQTDQGVQQELSSLRRQLAESRTALASALGGATPEQVAAYEARIRDLENQLILLRRQSAETPPAVATPAGLSGQVIEVGPKSAFVVLNIGSKHGATAAMELVLRRGQNQLARIQLTDVRENYSIANVLPETGTGNIRTGDVASRP